MIQVKELFYPNGTIVYDRVLRNIGVVVGRTFVDTWQYQVYCCGAANTSARSGEWWWPMRDTDLIETLILEK